MLKEGNLIHWYICMTYGSTALGGGEDDVAE